MRILKSVTAGVVLLLTLAVFHQCLAQTASTGALSGTVTDPAGAVVTGANVTATNAATGESRSTVSDANGAYRIPLLPPGSYRVEASSSGFKTVSFPTVTVVVTEI